MKLDDLFKIVVNNVSDKETEASMLLTDNHLNLMGRSHGGNQAYLCICAMRESIGAPSSMRSFYISYLAPVAHGTVMTAHGVTRRNGRQIVHTEAQIMAAGKLAAMATGIFTKDIMLDAPTIYGVKPDQTVPGVYYLHDDGDEYAQSVKSILAMNDRKTMAALAAQTKGSFCIAMKTGKIHTDASGMVDAGLLPILADISSGQAVASVVGLSVTVSLSCTVVGRASVGDTLTAHGSVCAVNGSFIHTHGYIYAGRKLIATTNAVFYHHYEPKGRPE